MAITIDEVSNCKRRDTPKVAKQSASDAPLRARAMNMKLRVRFRPASGFNIEAT
jgi:hypothetical protein